MNFTSTSLAPRPMTVVFGLGTRLRVRMRTTLENGVLRNEQLSGSTVDFSCVEKVRKLRIPYGTRETRCNTMQLIFLRVIP